MLEFGNFLILRKPRSTCLEGCTALLQPIANLLVRICAKEIDQTANDPKRTKYSTSGDQNGNFMPGKERPPVSFCISCSA